MGAEGFFPSIGLATTTLDSIVWNLLNSQDESITPDRLEKTEAMLASFRKYVGSLLKVLPKEILKVEGALRSLEIEKDAGTDMSKAGKLTEAVAGDLDGINVAAIATAEITKTEVADVVDPVKLVTTETVVADAAVAVAKDAATEVVAEVAVVAAPDMAAVLSAIEGLNSTLKGLQETVTKTQDETKTLAERMGTVEQLAKEATAKANKPVVVVNKSEDNDFALSSLGSARRPEVKTRFTKDGSMGDSLWDGLFGELEDFRPSS
jgi:uncharacterized coiled-coil protein SlyX